MLLNDILTILTSRLDHNRTVSFFTKQAHLHLVKPYLRNVQTLNNKAVNESLNRVLIEEEAFSELRKSVDQFDNFDVIGTHPSPPSVVTGYCGTCLIRYRYNPAQSLYANELATNSTLPLYSHKSRERRIKQVPLHILCSDATKRPPPPPEGIICHSAPTDLCP